MAKRESQTIYTRAGLAVAAVVVLFAGWIFYSSVLTKPRLAWAVPLPKKNAGLHARFVAPGKVLQVTSDKIALYQAASGKELWSAPLDSAPVATRTRKKAAPTEFSIPGMPSMPNLSVQVLDDDEDDSLDFGGLGFGQNSDKYVKIIGNDVWICLGNVVRQFDLKSGAARLSVPYQGQLESFMSDKSGLLVVSAERPDNKFVTMIDPAAGTHKSEEIKVERGGRVFKNGDDLPGGLPPTAAVLLAQELNGRLPGQEGVDRNRTQFIAAGDNVAELQVNLTEENMVAMDAIKRTKNSKLNANTTAAGSAGLATEIFNEMKRNSGAGIRWENHSKYQVTLKRRPADGAPDWSGELKGNVELYPLKTVDVLMAGKSIHLFDKKNQKIKEHALTFFVHNRFVGDERRRDDAPCVETNNTLYFFDQGVLTAMDLPGGDVRWRLPSVWISRLNFDAKGAVYVETTTAAPEDIEYSESVAIAQRVKPLLIKVDARSGKTLWKTEQTGQECFVAGKYLYVTKVNSGGLDLSSTGGSLQDGAMHFRIFRLNPSSGKVIWEYYHKGAPREVDFQEKRILLRYDNELQMLKFMGM
ncbi:MAG: hypothetical protein H7X97_11425 [Opitutaceae bacterium]|nr:hypothetical protein [Verrucomicrobiales bacterium]